ncbi:Gfo/Idh/MocA family oxidoreductase [Myxococcota bacterium]|nr:Gfo/Idh/MocA family oxidoreductase [Myxococcota bacterium]
MLRIGLIGLGRHGFRYARHLFRGDVPGATLTAVSRRDPVEGRAFAEQWRARWEPDAQALIEAPDVDAVIAAIPVGSHVDVALRVAAAGKPLLIEKPMAPTVADARRMVDAFATANRPLMVGQTLRFDPLTVMLRTKLAELQGLRGFRFEQRLEPRGLPWEDDPAQSAGGVVMQTGIHVFDALRFVTGARAVRVTHASLARMYYARNEDHALVHATLEDAALTRGGPAILGDVGVSKIGTSRHMRYTLFLDQVGLEADYVARTFTETHLRDRKVTTVEEAPTVVKTIEGFKHAIDGTAPNPIPGEDALESLALVEATYAVARRP